MVLRDARAVSTRTVDERTPGESDGPMLLRLTESA